jgi:uncharacterized protein with von Willebrand factor type A (vWA) domain
LGPHADQLAASQLRTLWQANPRASAKDSRIRSATSSDAFPLLSNGSEWLAESSEEVSSHRIGIYSSVEAIKEKDFAAFSLAELNDARAFLRSIEWKAATRRSRRRVPARDAHEIDMRRLLRRSLRHGGEVVELPRLGLRTKRRRLVVLCDISGSMDRYARMLLHFLHAIKCSYGGAEVFVFGTRLTRITHAIRDRDADEAISTVIADVHDWASGTRIGDAIATFNRTWSRRVAAHGAIVLIISDGWDRGDPEQLRAEIGRLQRSISRLIWLNPLLGSPSYEPVTRGMRAAMPYIDDFLPAHNLVSLQSLAVLLNSLSITPQSRPARNRLGNSAAISRRPGDGSVGIGRRNVEFRRR